MRAPSGVSRRGFLVGAGAVGAGAFVVGAGAAHALEANSTDLVHHPPVDFYGQRQAGIATAQQDRLVFAAFDVVAVGSLAQRRAAVRDMLATWTRAAEAMTNGDAIPGLNNAPLTPPADTGEAFGLDPARLTITVGYGPAFFDNRLGLESKRPTDLAVLAPLPGDELDSANSGGDVCIQACSDDPQVAFHAVRNLGRGIVVMRWSQLGFGRTSQTTSEQQTPRNLLGFKDGTRNIRSDDHPTMDEFVWVGDDSDQSWFRDGTYVVTRRIRMLIEAWDRDFLQDQQDVIGRDKYAGAPLSGGSEFTAPNFDAKDAAGDLQIAADAHIRLASREHNGGIQILRRGYSFTDGTDRATGQFDAGLFFIGYMRRPEQFIKLQSKLGASDALNEYIKHVGSAVFACPPGLKPGQSWAENLFT
jgi:deferrochelatase/peroxidase EfeB